jgi:ribosomal protein L31E
MYWDTKNIKESNEVWDNIKDFARRHKCTKVQFSTKRNGKIWERRFTDMKTIQWKIEANL